MSMREYLHQATSHYLVMQSNCRRLSELNFLKNIHFDLFSCLKNCNTHIRVLITIFLSKKYPFQWYFTQCRATKIDCAVIRRSCNMLIWYFSQNWFFGFWTSFSNVNTTNFFLLLKEHTCYSASELDISQF